MDHLKLLLILTLASILPGQLIRIPPNASLGAVTISDVLVFLTVGVFLSYSFLVKKRLKIDTKIATAFTTFVLLSATSTILAKSQFTLPELANASLLFLRFIFYFLIYILVANIVKKNQIIPWINIFLTIGVVFSLVGFWQFLTFSDLTFLVPLGWDPHQNRIVSTFLDPNFAGGYQTIIFSLAISFYLFSHKAIYLIVALVSFSSLVLTFSRSSYLAFLTSLLFIGVAKSPKILIGFLLFFAVIFALISNVRTRIIGAITLDETAQARIISWQRAATIAKDNFYFGVGFNTYRFAQVKYGFFSVDSPEGGHSGAGADSSLLLVLATTGLIGFAAFLFLLLTVFRKIIKNTHISPIQLGASSSFLALLVHSQFVNSLFFPQIMLSLWFIVGLSLANDS